MTTYSCQVPTIPARWTRVAFLGLVALLPLHTVFLRAEIAVKPWLILLVIVVIADALSGSARHWSRRALIGVGVFLLLALVSWPASSAGTSFWRLFLALCAGCALMLVVGHHARALNDVLRVVFWSGAVMAATAFFLGLITSGVFGAEIAEGINDLPLVERVNKPAYLGSGFVALTNWHQDPGYAALWTNVWLLMAIVAWARGVVRAPAWLPPLVIGGLGLASVLTFSRTGWGGLVLAVAASLYVTWRDGSEPFRRGLRVLLWGTVAGLSLLGVQILADPAGVGGDITTSIDFRFSYLLAIGQIDTGEVGAVDPTLVVDDNRVAVWSEYLDRFFNTPVRGIGLGTGWSEVGLQEPHNLGVQLLAETGVLGFVGFLVLLLALGRVADPLPASVVLVVLVAGVAQTVLFEAALWFALGLWLAVSQPLRRQMVGEPTVQEVALNGR